MCYPISKYTGMIERESYMNILEEIADKTRERIKEEKERTPLSVLEEKIQKKADFLPHSFLKALKTEEMSYICEVKKASPSKGLIAPDFPYVEIAREYEAAGADTISCLTEPFYFQGSDLYLEEISEAVEIPVLRKDFTVDEYMVYQARALGASAVLLICAILDDKELRAYRELSEELGMDALVEAHDQKEVNRALKAGAKIIGVNNRDLRTFQVDMANSIRLRELVPKDVVFVSESGIRTCGDIQKLWENRVDAVLIGETLMRSPDKRAALAALKTKMTKIKICGLRRKEDIEAVNEAVPDYCGFVIEVPKSPRSVTREQVRELVKGLRKEILPVGVFVNAPVELVAELLADGTLAMAQLHGQEDENYLTELRTLTRKPLIQAFSIKSSEDVKRAVGSSADYILLDQGSGGTGRPFDWSLLGQIPRPFFLAGGLGTENLRQAIQITNPWAVDLSSSLEVDGWKDAGKIMEAVRLVRQAGRADAEQK